MIWTFLDIYKFVVLIMKSQPASAKLQYSFVELIFLRFKIEFLSGSIIDFLLYHCNLFVGVVIKVCLLRYILSDEFVGILNSPFLP